MWRRDSLTVFAEALDMDLDCLADQLHSLITALTHRNTARKIRDVGTKGCFSLLDDHNIFHGLHPQGFFNPACFQMLPSVPVGTSTLKLPATVTVPGFDG